MRAVSRSPESALAAAALIDPAARADQPHAPRREPQNQASMTARLAAWNQREMRRLERKAQRQARGVKGAARMARSGRPRGLAGTSHET